MQHTKAHTPLRIYTYLNYEILLIAVGVFYRYVIVANGVIAVCR